MVHAEFADETLRTQSAHLDPFNFAYFASNFCALCVNLTFEPYFLDVPVFYG
ncbi:MAG: hypothetical protein IEMM0006_0721 [bacterium]|nr:MAG: hypothetical protein IEMM0006_0721 [bacterium]